MEFELETNEKTAKDVLEYLFSYYGESVKTDFYFKKVSSYLWSILNTEMPLSEIKTGDEIETIFSREYRKM